MRDFEFHVSSLFDRPSGDRKVIFNRRIGVCISVVRISVETSALCVAGHSEFTPTIQFNGLGFERLQFGNFCRGESVVRGYRGEDIDSFPHSRFFLNRFSKHLCHFTCY